jgi:hypothetical protein
MQQSSFFLLFPFSMHMRRFEYSPKQPFLILPCRFYRKQGMFFLTCVWLTVHQVPVTFILLNFVTLEGLAMQDILAVILFCPSLRDAYL